MKTITFIFFGLLLVSCTSEPLDVRYYLLHTPSQPIKTTADQANLPIVLVQKIKLADYLRQSSMSMQIGQHEMYYSRQDVWAETLQSSFQKALLQDLNISTQHLYTHNFTPNTAQTMANIELKLEHFHATDDSTVITSGQYWITPTTSKNTQNVSANSIVQNFYFELTLEEDGYPHAVKQLRKLVTMLSKQINQDTLGMTVAQ
jgi:uncharacterized lipoprotein YmbA